jgi:hypothetical protein
MTNQLHPITPPEDLLQRLRKLGSWQEIITKAYQAGADQELDACVKAIKQIWGIEHVVTDDDVMCELRAIRRPKPQTLNSVALQMLGTIERDAHYIPEITDTIRRALESTND